MDQNQAITVLPGDALVDSIKENLESLSSLSTNCCIYKAPERLRRLNPDAYSPRVVSIGPLHYGKEELQAMEDHKLRYLQSFIPRTALSLEDLVGVARTWEERARFCYTEDVRLSSNEFVKMLIVDASFLVELLLRSQFDVYRGMLDRIYGKQKMIVDVNHDVMLLENQLPYFVVEGMFGLLHVDYHRELPPLTRIIHNHFKKFWMSIPSFSRSISDSKICHFVDLLRSIHLPLVLSFPGGSMRMMDSVQSAKEIQNAGVKLQPADNNTCALDISFANGVLTIPKIKINDITESLYRNIILFEQCHRLDVYFIHYMRFLSCFIRSPMDAELFIDHFGFQGKQKGFYSEKLPVWGLDFSKRIWCAIMTVQVIAIQRIIGKSTVRILSEAVLSRAAEATESFSISLICASNLALILALFSSILASFSSAQGRRSGYIL